MKMKKKKKKKKEKGKDALLHENPIKRKKKKFLPLKKNFLTRKLRE